MLQFFLVRLPTSAGMLAAVSASASPVQASEQITPVQVEPTPQEAAAGRKVAETMIQERARVARLRKARGAISNPLSLTVRTRAEDADAIDVALDDLDAMLRSKRKLAENSWASTIDNEATEEVSADFVERVSGGCTNSVVAADPFLAMLSEGERYGVKQNQRLAYLIICRAVWKGYLTAARKPENSGS